MKEKGLSTVFPQILKKAGRIAADRQLQAKIKEHQACQHNPIISKGG